jgi:DNA-directed RNA polymerase specialized sigma24 family protein
LDDDDAALLRQAEAGQTLAFERIAWRYDEAILSWLLMLTGSEQEALVLCRATFVTAYRELARRDTPSLYVWLYRIAAEQWLRRRERRHDRPSAGGALARLSTQEVLVYTLKAGQGLSLRTVAQILNAPGDTVARTFCQAIAKLQVAGGR